PKGGVRGWPGRSFMPGGVPLKGGMGGPMRVTDLNIWGVRYPRVPPADVPMLNLAPAVFAIATTSPIVLAGNEGCASKTTGIDAISPIGAKSLRGSKPALA